MQYDGVPLGVVPIDFAGHLFACVSQLRRDTCRSGETVRAAFALRVTRGADASVETSLVATLGSGQHCTAAVWLACDVAVGARGGGGTDSCALCVGPIPGLLVVRHGSVWERRGLGYTPSSVYVVGACMCVGFESPPSSESHCEPCLLPPGCAWWHRMVLLCWLWEAEAMR